MLKLEDFIMETSMNSKSGSDKIFINEETKEVYYERLSKIKPRKDEFQTARPNQNKQHLLKVIQNEGKKGIRPTIVDIIYICS